MKHAHRALYLKGSNSNWTSVTEPKAREKLKEGSDLGAYSVLKYI